jgi:6-phosphogluconolactonase (cycloisomerase 2 family)
MLAIAAAGCGGGAGGAPGRDAGTDWPVVDALADARTDAPRSDGANVRADAALADAGQAHDARPLADAAQAHDTHASADAAVGRDAHVSDAAVERDAHSSDDAAVERDAHSSDDAAAGSDAHSSDDAAAGGDADSPTDAGRPGIMVVATLFGGISSFTLDASGAPSRAGAALDTDAQFYAVTASPSGSFVYAADFRGRVYGYRVGRADGTLTPVPGSPVIIGGQAIAARIDPRGRVLYVANNGDDALYVFSIDGASGALTAVDGSPLALAAASAGIALHPTAALAFVSTVAQSAAGGGGIHVFNLDPTSGKPTGEIAGSPFFPTLFGGALVMHPSGKFLYDSAFGVHAYAVAPSGALTEPLGSPHPGAASDNQAIDIALDPTGRHLYASSNALGTVTAYGVDSAGAFTDVEGFPFEAGEMPYSVAVDPAGRFIYVGNDDAEKVSVFPLDVTTGALRVPITGSPFTVRGLQPEIVLIGP